MEMHFVIDVLYSRLIKRLVIEAIEVNNEFDFIAVGKNEIIFRKTVPSRMTKTSDGWQRVALTVRR